MARSGPYVKADKGQSCDAQDCGREDRDEDIAFHAHLSGFSASGKST